MKKRILYTVFTVLITGSILITSCGSEKKVDTTTRDSVKTDSANEPDAAKIKKDSV